MEQIQTPSGSTGVSCALWLPPSRRCTTTPPSLTPPTSPLQVFDCPLIIIRSVIAAAGHRIGCSPGTVEAGSEEVGKRKRDEMAELEADLDAATAQPVSRLPGFVSAGVIQQGGQAQAAGPEAVPGLVENPEDIDIDEAEVGDGDGGEEIQLEQQPVPVRVLMCQRC